MNNEDVPFPPLAGFHMTTILNALPSDSHSKDTQIMVHQDNRSTITYLVFFSLTLSSLSTTTANGLLYLEYTCLLSACLLAYLHVYLHDRLAALPALLRVIFIVTCRSIFLDKKHISTHLLMFSFILLAFRLVILLLQ